MLLTFVFEMALCVTIWYHVRTVTSSSISLPSLLRFLPVAHAGTSQEDTDEGSVLGDDGGVTKHDGTDDRANTSADYRDGDDDHTSSHSQSSRYICLLLVILFYSASCA